MSAVPRQKQIGVDDGQEKDLFDAEFSLPARRSDFDLPGFNVGNTGMSHESDCG
jgi:hypothetical protein